MIEELMKLFDNNKYKQPFKIVHHSGELPEELKQFVSTVGEVDSKPDNQSVKKP